MTCAPQSYHVAIACGGTGGHLFPGLAVADELAARDCSVTLLVSPKDVDQQAVKGVAGMEVATLPAVGLQDGRLVAFLAGFMKSRREAKRLFTQRRPQAVLAMGGFTSAPPVLAGRALGAVTFLHESNTVPGRANRWLAHVVDECFTGFPETAARLWNPRVTHTGTPVRTQFQPADPEACRVALGLDPQQPVLVVMGGSQGARGLNQLFAGALTSLSAALPELQYFHLTGAADFETMRAVHARAGRRSLVRPFFSEMELLLAAATIVLSRAGASSLAELAAMGVPAILVPFPAATDNHQFHNASACVRSGAAMLLPERGTTPEALAHEIQRIVTNPVRRDSMAAAMARGHAPDAAARIADHVLRLTAEYHPLPPAVPAQTAPLRLRPQTPEVA